MKLVSTYLVRDPEAWAWRVDLQESAALQQAALYMLAGEDDRAKRVLKQSEQRLMLSAPDAQSAINVLRFRIINRAMQADLAERSSDPGLARQYWLQVVELAGNQVEGIDGAAAVSLAKAWQGLGRTREAEELSAQLAVAGYRYN